MDRSILERHGINYTAGLRRFMEDEIIHYYMTTKDKRDYDMWVRALEKKEVDYNKWIKSVTNDELKRFL